MIEQSRAPNQLGLSQHEQFLTESLFELELPDYSAKISPRHHRPKPGFEVFPVFLDRSGPGNFGTKVDMLADDLGVVGSINTKAISADSRKPYII